MPTKSTAAKSPKAQEQDTRAVASAGPKGIALAPPAYGIDFVDRAPGGRWTPATHAGDRSNTRAGPSTRTASRTIDPTQPHRPSRNTVRLSATRVSVISCVSRKPGFHGGSDHDAARTLFGCDTGPGEYSGSAEGLSKVVPPEVMEQALSETGMSGQRSCKLSHRVMLWIVLAMGLLAPTDSPGLQARGRRPNEKTPSRSNLCEAR